jgi:hypothetical protein
MVLLGWLAKNNKRGTYSIFYQQAEPVEHHCQLTGQLVSNLF